jgi:regulator of protease activity HflC (stomatin/prohibitin superfamily)
MDDALDISSILTGSIAILVVLLAVFGLPAMVRSWRKASVVVDETVHALRISRGRIAEVLQPGVYSTWLKPYDRIELLNAREASFTVPGQEMLSADFLSVKLTLLVRYRIEDPRAYRSVDSNPTSNVYEAAQIMLRERVGKLALDALLADRGALMSGFQDELDARALRLGMKLLSVELRDLALSGPAKQAFADIWKAQKEGQAALERARGEQASLRSLANAARMLKGNPELMNLRLLQALASASGKSAPTVVLGGGAGLLPVRNEADATGDGES